MMKTEMSDTETFQSAQNWDWKTARNNEIGLHISHRIEWIIYLMLDKIVLNITSIIWSLVFLSSNDSLMFKSAQFLASAVSRR